MAEAMSLGKAVVATAFGGNTSFMTMDTAGLVGFGMRQIVKEDHALQPAYKRVYRPGRWWAEPDIEHAASKMKEAYQEARNKDLAHKIRSFAEEQFSVIEAGKRMALQLKKIDLSVLKDF